MAKIDTIAKNVKLLRENLVEKIPGHFGPDHIIASFFGSILVAGTFVLKGLLFNVGLSITGTHLIYITIATWIILTLEIYFVGYERVPDKYQRRFGQFWLKRIITYYLIAILTSGMLLWLYQITEIAGSPYNAFKLIVAVSFPAAIGAAVADLVGKY